MPRRRRSMAPTRSSRSVVSVVRRASCSAASSSARRLTPPSCSRSCLSFSTRFSACSSGGSSSPSLISARSASSSGADSSSSWMRVRSSSMRSLRRLPTGPGRGRVPRARRTARGRPPSRCLSASASMVLGFGAGIGRLLAGSFGRGDRVEQRVALFGTIASGTASAAASSAASSSRRRSSSSICCAGSRAACLPARAVRRRWRQGGGARVFAFALAGRRGSARFTAGGAGFGGALRGLRPRRLRQRYAIAEFGQSLCGLPCANSLAASRDWSRRRISASSVASCEARSAAARAARVASSCAAISACSVLRSSCSAARAACARGLGGVLGRGIDRQTQRRGSSLARIDFGFQRRETIALRQPHGGRRRRIGGGRHSRPSATDRRAPTPGAGRASIAFAAPRPDRGTPARSWPGGGPARPAPARNRLSGLHAVGQRRGAHRTRPDRASDAARPHPAAPADRRPAPRPAPLRSRAAP